jgi:hypothetical protein
VITQAIWPTRSRPLLDNFHWEALSIRPEPNSGFRSLQFLDNAPTDTQSVSYPQGQLVNNCPGPGCAMVIRAPVPSAKG